jgi:hypothetical protein
MNISETTKGARSLVREVKAARRAYAKTPAGQLEALEKKRIYWQRKETLAMNKLREVISQITLIAVTLAEKEAGHASE